MHSNCSDSLNQALFMMSARVKKSVRYYLCRQNYDGSDAHVIASLTFSCKEEFLIWRKLLFEKNLVEWTSGWLFKLKDDDCHYTLVDKHGKEPKRL